MADNNKKQYIKYEDTTYILEDHRLPDPTDADNGKVLGVVNGEYALKEEEGGGSGAVTSVNGKTGTVVLDASDVGALPDDTVIPTKTSDLQNDSGFLTQHQSLSAYRTASAQDSIDAAQDAAIGAKYSKPSGGIPASDLAAAVQTSLGKADTALQSAPVTSVNTKTGAVTLTASDVGALPSSTSIPTKVSDLANDSGYQTAQQVQTAIAAIPDELPDVTSASANDFLCLNAQKQPIWKTVPAAESNSFGGGS